MPDTQDSIPSTAGFADRDVWVVMAVVANLEDEDAYADGDYFVESVWGDEELARARAREVFQREEYHCVRGAFCAEVEVELGSDHRRANPISRPRPAAVAMRFRVQP